MLYPCIGSYEAGCQFGNAAEADKWINAHLEHDELFSQLVSDCDTGTKTRLDFSMMEFALEECSIQKLKKLFDGYDVNRYPKYYEEMLYSVVNRLDTEFVERWLNRYPESSYWTGERPVTRHVELFGNPCRAQLANRMVKSLHRRGVDVHKYTHPMYSSAIRETAYTELHLPVKSCLQAAKESEVI